MKKNYINNITIQEESDYNYQDHQIRTITERMPLEPQKLILETDNIKFALGNLFEAIVLFYSRLNSETEIFEQVATLEANWPFPLSKKTKFERLYDNSQNKIKGGVRCDIFSYQPFINEGSIIETKWGKKPQTIQSGFDTYPTELMQRFKQRTGLDSIKQYTVGILPFENLEFQTNKNQTYTCFPFLICSKITQNKQESQFLKKITANILEKNKEFTQLKEVLNTISNKSNISTSEIALATAKEIAQKVPFKKGAQENNFFLRDNISYKINSLILEFICMLSSIEDNKELPQTNIQILKEIEFLTEIINNISNYSHKEQTITQKSKIYQILFIAIKQFKINFENLYIKLTTNPEDFYSLQEEEKYKDLITIEEEYKKIIQGSLNHQKLILQEAIIKYNFKYSNYQKLNFITIKTYNSYTTYENPSSVLSSFIKPKIFVTNAEIDKIYNPDSFFDLKTEATINNKKVLNFDYLSPFISKNPFLENQETPFFIDYDYNQALEDYDKLTLSKLSYIAKKCTNHKSFLQANINKFQKIPTLFIDFMSMHYGNTTNTQELRLHTLDFIISVSRNYDGPITHLLKESKQLSFNFK